MDSWAVSDFGIMNSAALSLLIDVLCYLFLGACAHGSVCAPQKITPRSVEWLLQLHITPPVGFGSSSIFSVLFLVFLILIVLMVFTFHFSVHFSDN